MPDLARAALWYARHGWRVFPAHTIMDGICSCRKGAACDRAGKHPRVKHGVKEASQDPAVIGAWWRRWPTANIGIACGPPSGLFAIDVDRKGGEDGVATLAQLEKIYGRLPPTIVQQTGSGGFQLFYRDPTASLGNSCRYLGPGLDTRGRGGFVIGPPSMHLSGAHYRWLRGPHEHDIAELPAKWAERLRAREEQIRPTATEPRYYSVDTQDRLIRSSVERVRRAAEGTRNNTLYGAAFALAVRAREGRINWREAEAELIRAGTAIGLGEIEVRRTVSSALKGAKQVEVHSNELLARRPQDRRAEQQIRNLESIRFRRMLKQQRAFRRQRGSTSRDSGFER